MPETKNKSSAERKGFFSRRSKNTPKSEKKRNAAQNAAAELQLFEYFEQELERKQQAAKNEGGGLKRSPRKPISKKEINAQKNAEKGEVPEKNTRTKSESKKNAPAASKGGRSKKTADSKTSAKESAASKKGKKNKAAEKQPVEPVRIVPLGGLGEIGKNMTLIEYKNDIVIIDCGLAFPDDDMYGVDLVIPDFSYVVKNKDKIRGIVITHGHEDHIGALSYLLKEVNVPVYSCMLTIGLVEGKLKEAGILSDCNLIVKKAGDQVKMGDITIEFIAVNHSIPDACGFAIFTPAGTIVHTGDFKIDYTPVDGQMIDLARFGELGRHGVLALMADSTNAERPGITPSERKVGESFEMLFKKAGDRRIIIASFSSNVHRIQQVIDTAVRHGRGVVVSGRSMENVVAKSAELGYLKIPEGTLIDIDRMRNIPDENIVIITTGSQGEPMSALTRMARGEHRKINVTAHDFIIISATPIPGNEKLVGKVINDLMALGSEVIYERTMGIHVSGHACREELKTIIGLTKPKYFIPVHGEVKHLFKSRELAMEMGIEESNIIVSEVGRVIELSEDSAKAVTTVPSGAVMVDGSGIGDVGSIVLRDRKLLAEEGLIIVVGAIDSKTGALLAGPVIVSRGFVYVRESEELMTEAKEICKKALSAAEGANGMREWANLKQAVKDQLSSYLFSKTKRRPMILPIIQDI